MEKNNQLIQRKINFYKDSNKWVHITLEDGKFRNGLIKYIGADFILIDDLENREWTIFFLEIVNVEEYRERVE